MNRPHDNENDDLKKGGIGDAYKGQDSDLVRNKRIPGDG